MRTTWRVNTIIRNRLTAKPYLVIQVIRDTATIVVDSEARGLQQPVVLLERDYDEYCRDKDMKCREREDYIDKWDYDQMPSVL